MHDTARFATMAVSGGTFRMRTSALLVSLGCCLVTVVPVAHAQTSHTVSQSTLDAAVQQHLSMSQDDRDAVLRLLVRPEIRQMAAEAGVDLHRAQDAVRTLDAESLTAIAAHARQAEEALAGGQSRVTISTTMIIIGLLVLILLIVALK
jgi:hypothetical protein